MQRPPLAGIGVRVRCERCGCCGRLNIGIRQTAIDSADINRPLDTRLESFRLRMPCVAIYGSLEIGGSRGCDNLGVGNQRKGVLSENVLPDCLVEIISIGME